MHRVRPRVRGVRTDRGHVDQMGHVGRWDRTDHHGGAILIDRLERARSRPGLIAQARCTTASALSNASHSSGSASDPARSTGYHSAAAKGSVGDGRRWETPTTTSPAACSFHSTAVPTLPDPPLTTTLIRDPIRQQLSWLQHHLDAAVGLRLEHAVSLGRRGQWNLVSGQIQHTQRVGVVLH